MKTEYFIAAFLMIITLVLAILTFITSYITKDYKNLSEVLMYVGMIATIILGIEFAVSFIYLINFLIC